MFNCIYWDFDTSEQWKHGRIEYNKETGMAQEKELNLKLDPCMIPHIDQFEDLDTK